jgi:diguanylate cyclase
VKAAPDTEDWRSKYFESLRSLESEGQQFRAMEAALKRIAGRLCIASLGQSSDLDDQIRRLQVALRRDVSSDDLDQITAALTDAIHALDEATAAHPIAAVSPTNAATNAASSSSTQAIIGDERVRAILAALLAELKRDPELIKPVEALDVRLAASLTHDQLPNVLSALSEIVGQRIQRIERAKREVEALLSQMVVRLDEIGQFVADHNHNQTQTLASSATLAIQVSDDMKAMGETVESAADLQQIRAQVRHRLDSIGQHLQEFQERETTRASAMQTRNEQMQTRVVELEAEANRLHNQLKQEQQLSLIDVLTQVPNRMAYEKRSEEELKRWQRFKQPGCVAAWDIDHFKKINDTYGHRAGDRVLLTVAKCLATQVRATDFLARYGGEEFVMILTGTQLEDAMRLIDEMRIAVGKLRFHFRGTAVSVTISCGVTELMMGDTSGAAFDRADKALYRAKDSGRNCCVSG